MSCNRYFVASWITGALKYSYFFSELKEWKKKGLKKVWVYSKLQRNICGLQLIIRCQKSCKTCNEIHRHKISTLPNNCTCATSFSTQIFVKVLCTIRAGTIVNSGTYNTYNIYLKWFGLSRQLRWFRRNGRDQQYLIW